jgi:hypothetical protein
MCSEVLSIVVEMRLGRRTHIFGVLGSRFPRFWFAGMVRREGKKGRKEGKKNSDSLLLFSFSIIYHPSLAPAPPSGPAQASPSIPMPVPPSVLPLSNLW